MNLCMGDPRNSWIRASGHGNKVEDQDFRAGISSIANKHARSSTLLRVPLHSSPAHLKRKLLLTTLTLLKAIAAPAIMGSNRKPLKG